MKNPNTIPVKDPMFTSAFFIVGIITLIINGINSIQMLILPLYVESHGANSLIMGLMTTGFTVTAVLFKKKSGESVGKYGLRMPLILGYGFSTIIMFLTCFIMNPTLIIPMRLLFGCGITFASTSIGKAAADNIPKSRIIEGMGYIGMVSTVAMSIGNAVGVNLGATMGYQGILLVTVAIMALAVVLSVLFMNKKYVNLPKDKIMAEENKQKAISMWKEKKALPIMFSLLILLMASTSTMTFLVSYCKEIGLTNIGLYFTISTVSSLGIRLFAGRLADKKGAKVVLIPCFIIMAANYLLLPFITTATQLYLMGFIVGAANGMLTPSLQALLVSFCPGRTGNASAMYYMAVDAGFGLGGIVFGFAAMAGYRPMFLASGVLTVIALLVYLYGDKKCAMISG